MSAHRGGIVVLDFGGQYSMLIARRVRELGVYSEILPYFTPWSEVMALEPSGVILSGGPDSIYLPDAPRPDPALWGHGGSVPVLGICYGMQLMAHELGGAVERGQRSEYGNTPVNVHDAGRILQGLGQQASCWMSHRDHVVSVPPGFRVLAGTGGGIMAAMADEDRGLYGLQFHPEVTHTPAGRSVLSAFVLDVCRAACDWTAASFVESAVEAIREQIGDGRVVCGVSGGVDSTTVAFLLDRAIGDRLTCIFVDHGLMRKNEPGQVVETFGRHLKGDLVAVDASERFLTALRGITDPERKRKIIGHLFIEVFEEQARQLGDVRFLAQGTLYPDVVESGIGQAALIKTHHNVGGLPEKLGLELVEPVRNLFKDEVRAVARQLGVPAEMVSRRPFPGPGLAVRVMGEITEEKLDLVRESDAILRDEIGRWDGAATVWQVFTVLTETRSVGVTGDGRSYGRVVAIRAVTSEDAMTADWARLPHDLLARISSRILNEVDGVGRVVYDITSKPPGTIEWE